MKNSKHRLVLLLLACVVMLSAVAVEGTLAYLTATSPVKTKTYTMGSMSIALSGNPADVAAKEGQIQIVPGTQLLADYSVTINSDADCYAFIRVEESGWPVRPDGTRLMEYALDGWQELAEAPGVYYREYRASAAAPLADHEENLLVGREIRVRSDMTAAEVQQITQWPRLTFGAYIIQMTKGKADFTPAEAWAQLGE